MIYKSNRLHMTYKKIQKVFRWRFATLQSYRSRTSIGVLIVYYIFRHPGKFWNALSEKSKKWTLRGLVFLLIILIAIPTSIWLGSKKTQAAWWNDSWQYRKSIAVTNNTSAESNVYVSVTIDTSDATRFKTNCGDLRFTKLNGELLPYYIVSGCGTASTVVHTNFDVFPAGAQTIYYYYGNPSAIDGFSGVDFATQASNYTVGSIGSEEKGTGPVAYWSFDEGQGIVAHDSSPQKNNGDIVNATWSNSGKFGKALSFNGSQYVSLGDPASLEMTDQFTLSAWINPTDVSNYQQIISKFGSAGNYAYQLNIAPTGNLRVDISGDGTAYDYELTTTISPEAKLRELRKNYEKK